MLEHVPSWLGRALSGVRAGAEKLAIVELGRDLPSLELMSPAFGHGGRLPPRFTADGEGVSPPLVWTTPPAGTAMLALLVEDADAPAPQPLAHAVVWGLPADAGRLEEGAIVADGDGFQGRDVGVNAFRREGWLPPDPPTGHGEHRYCFQLFALDARTPDPGGSPSRGAMVEAMRGHVLAAGLLVGTYARGEPAAAGAVGATAPA
jgi:Raf kinase inhibitor-like YbhB/YbcL family protein